LSARLSKGEPSEIAHLARIEAAQSYQKWECRIGKNHREWTGIASAPGGRGGGREEQRYKVFSTLHIGENVCSSVRALGRSAYSNQRTKLLYIRNVYTKEVLEEGENDVKFASFGM
jgi:hypothetical protein